MLFQVAEDCYMLKSRATTYAGFKKLNAIVTERKGEINFMQSLEAPRTFAKRACYTLQSTCTLSRNAIARKIVSYNTAIRRLKTD